MRIAQTKHNTDNMSEQQNNGQRRNQGGNRNNNRNRNNNNRNNNNRNRNNNNRGKNRNYKKREPKPLVLTRWQKFLKAIGLFNEEKARKQQHIASKIDKPVHRNKDEATKAHKNTNTGGTKNTRNAKTRRAPERVPVETPRLYVGNLSYDASDSDIEELFKGIGNVKNVEIIYNRHTHRSKGYGFVQMFNTEDAMRAVEVLHDQPFLGRNLIVNGSKARNPDDPSAKQNDNTEETADTSAA